MCRQNNTKSDFYNKVISKDNLSVRSGGNHSFALNDFDGWLSNIFQKIEFQSVLDICCGTGNQLVLYGQRNNMKLIAGIDSSEQSIEVAKSRLEKIDVTLPLNLRAMMMEDLIRNDVFNEVKFDVISCSYGLYYAENFREIIDYMIDHLTQSGTVIIVGPYGKNNAKFFDLLEEFYTLPDLVKRSSSTFMVDEVYPELSLNFNIEQKTFINKICYPSPAELVKYWKASTFYREEFEDSVITRIEKHFSDADEFVIEKNVIAYIAKRKL